MYESRTVSVQSWKYSLNKFTYFCGDSGGVGSKEALGTDGDFCVVHVEVDTVLVDFLGAADVDDDVDAEDEAGAVVVAVTTGGVEVDVDVLVVAVEDVLVDVDDEETVVVAVATVSVLDLSLASGAAA